MRKCITMKNFLVNVYRYNYSFFLFAGASISELNTIRKQISCLKGGGLARLAHPANILTLVLSDIIGDPLDLIASAPTIPNGDTKETALAILKKYSIDDDIPSSIKSVLESGEGLSQGDAIPVGVNGEFNHVKSFIIGRLRSLNMFACREIIVYSWRIVRSIVYY